jgi:hypothetical protein
MSLIFLDFDGVCHPASVFLKDGQPVLHGQGELFMWAPLLAQALDPYPDIQIVLSTTWQHVLGLEKARACLPSSLRSRVVGTTSDTIQDTSPYSTQASVLSKWHAMTRYQQILQYVQSMAVENWLAIDDDTMGWASEHLDHLIETNPALGLSDPDVVEQLRKALVNP